MIFLRINLKNKNIEHNQHILKVFYFYQPQIEQDIFKL
jgi:hypothetical protein